MLNSRATEVEVAFQGIDDKYFAIINDKFKPANFKGNSKKANEAKAQFYNDFEKEFKAKIFSIKTSPAFYRELSEKISKDTSYYPKACSKPDLIQNNITSDLASYEKAWIIILPLADHYAKQSK